MRTIIGVLFILYCNHPVYSQNFWQKTNGPYGGYVSSLGLDQHGYIFAGTGYGVFRSLRSSDNWNTYSTPSASGFAFDSNGIYMYASFGGQDYGIHRSSDQGLSWVRIMNGHYILYVYNLGVSALGTLLSATSDGIFRSTDHGENWAYQGLASISAWCFTVDKDYNLYVGTSQGLYYSTNDGVTWIAGANIGLIDKTINDLIVDGDNIFAATLYGIFKSTDRGDNWVSKNNGIAPYTMYGIVMSSEKNLYAASFGGGVCRSTDSGENWFISNDGLFGNRYLEAISIDVNDNLFVGSTFGGAFKSTDKGVNWFPFSKGLTNADVRTIYVHTEGSIFTGNYGSGIYRSTDFGNSWDPMNIGITNGMISKITINHMGQMFATSQSGGGVFRSTNDGQSWQPINNGISLTATLRDFLVTSTGTLLISGERFGIYRSTNNGETWDTTKNGLTNSSDGWAIIETTNGKLITGMYGDGIYYSTNQGDQWIKSNTGITDYGIRSLISDKDGYIFAGTNSGIFRSMNAGNSWEPVLSVSSVRDFIISKSGAIYAASSNGVYTSNDRGSTWYPLNDGLTTLSLYSLGIDSNNHLLAGTWDQGVFRSVNPVVSINDNGHDTPVCTLLRQNFPNPFNPTTRISYYLPVRGFVTISIYNSLGQKTRSLVSKHQNGGSHEIMWDGKNDMGHEVRSGVYFYRLVFGTFSQTKKMLLIR